MERSTNIGRIKWPSPQEVFRPGSFPTHTYVARAEDDFESHLQHALTIAGQLISISGPSKSGKTVLVEKVVGIDQLIVVTGAGIVSPEDIWRRALKSMDAPLRKTGSTGRRARLVKTRAQGEVG